MQCRASQKEIGFGRLCDIVHGICMAPEIVVPERIGGKLILMSSGIVTSFIYVWTLSDARFLLIFLWRPSNLIPVIINDFFAVDL